MNLSHGLVQNGMMSLNMHTWMLTSQIMSLSMEEYLVMYQKLFKRKPVLIMESLQKHAKPHMLLVSLHALPKSKYVRNHEPTWTTKTDHNKIIINNGSAGEEYKTLKGHNL